MKRDIMHCPVSIFVTIICTVVNYYVSFLQVRRKLDNSEHYTASCQPEKNVEYEEGGCNGRVGFCNIKINQFTFPGAHNSGTGQKDDPNLPCFYKNQDMNVREQLDFGIRFLDLDVIYSQSGNCKGLETGIG